MRRFLTIISALTLSGAVFAGGLVTNTNQSALYTRLQSRNASIGIDAVYYNPAGLTKLADGFHFSLNNQTIGQTKTISTSYAYLSENPKEYEGKVSAPFFPGVYAAYKKGNFAVSLGFNPIGGGGGAEYAGGLPSFEIGIADVVPFVSYILSNVDEAILASQGVDPHYRDVTGYNGDIYFKGSSIYFGYQLNGSYKINDMFSVGAGIRMVTAKNTYAGSVQNVTVDAPSAYGGTQTPGNYLRLVSGFIGGDASLEAYAVAADVKTNAEADASQAGTGFTPLLSVNITPNDMFNISLKYEFKTKLELTTTVYDNKDGAGMFTDGGKTIADMPAMLALGVDAKPLSKLLLSGSFNYYFDKNVDYDGSASVDENKIDKNFIELGLGAQYDLSDKLCISAGWLKTITGVNDNYQSDITYSLNTNTFGGGLGFKVNDMIGINLGGSYTIYQEGGKTYQHTDLLTATHNVADIYNKDTWIVAVGFDLHF